MFKKTHMVILDNDKNVDRILKLAANHHLHALYKIGVYGKERQDELYVIGRSSNYRAFKKELANINKREEETV